MPPDGAPDEWSDIKGNISLNNEDISQEEIERAAHIVNADTFINKMLGGFDEPVTERGSTFSADSGSCFPLRGRWLISR